MQRERGVRRVVRVVSIAGALALSGSAMAKPAPAAVAPERTAPEPTTPKPLASTEVEVAFRLSDEAKSRIADAVRTAAGQSRYRGCYVVVVGDSVVLCSGRGVRIPEAAAASDGAKPIDDRSTFEIASISKPFTAIAILQLVEQGKIDLDAPITRYLGEDLKGVANADASPAAKVTIRQMLSHQTGLDNDTGISPYDEPSRKAAVATFFSGKKLAEPGTRFDYDNAAYCMLAAIIEHVSGESFEAYMRAHLFTPAKMVGTGFPPGTDLDQAQRVRRKPGITFNDHPWGWGYRGCGGILTTPRDVVAFSRALDAGELIKPESLALMYAPGKPARGQLPDTTYGLGWFINTRDGMLRVSHSGGSFGCRANMVRYPNQRVTIAAFTDDSAEPFGITDAAEAALLAELNALRIDDVANRPPKAAP